MHQGREELRPSFVWCLVPGETVKVQVDLGNLSP